MFALKYKKIFAAILGISLVSSSCVKRIENFDEGSDARQAMKSTVKIYATVTGHKVVFVPKPDSEDFLEVDGGVETVSWVGSGVVVENDSEKNESLILSAAHVTTMGEIRNLHFEDDIHLFIAESLKLTIETLDGVKCDAEALVADNKYDVSAIVSKCVAGIPARLVKELPPVGAAVLVSGSALGYHPNGVFIVTDGRYLGIDSETKEEVLTLPVAGGHSGSAVYYRGEIIGIISKRMIRFEHITLGVSLENTKSMYTTAYKMWQMLGG